MNPQRVVLVAILIVSVFAAAAQPGLRPSPMSSDRMAVYLAFLGSYSKGIEHLKLARRTVPVELLKDECLRGIRFSKLNSSATVHEFDARTLPSSIILVDSEEQERIICNVDFKQTWRDGPK